MRGLSLSDKIRTINEWKSNPWFGWAIITLYSAKQQCEALGKDPTVQSSIREQALGEGYGVGRFEQEVKAVFSSLLEELAESQKPQKDQETQHEY